MPFILVFVSFWNLSPSNPTFYYRHLQRETQTQCLFTLERVGINRGAVDWNYPPMRTNGPRLYYNLDPGSSVYFADREIALTPDHVVFLPDGSFVGARTKVPARHCFIEFRQTVYSLPFTSIRIIPARPRYADLFGELHEAIRSENENVTLCLSFAILHLAAIDLDINCHMLPKELTNILTTIPRHQFRDTTASLARGMGYGVARFSHWFQSFLKISPAQYIRQAQLAEATRLLRSSEQSIDQIAEECGFPNRYYFSRVFSRSQGMGPSAYRKRAAASAPATEMKSAV